MVAAAAERSSAHARNVQGRCASICLGRGRGWRHAKQQPHAFDPAVHRSAVQRQKAFLCLRASCGGLWPFQQQLQHLCVAVQSCNVCRQKAVHGGQGCQAGFCVQQGGRTGCASTSSSRVQRGPCQIRQVDVLSDFKHLEQQPEAAQ